jgi:hypothetical protein
MQISENEYKRSFPEDKRAKALEKALDIRKFEIDLYWKRAAYFWTLIAAAFIGFMAVQNIDDAQKRTDFSIALACLGLIFSFGWHCAARGSKQWQENWENHVDMLEDDEIGPLYKTVLRRGSAEPGVKRIQQLLTGPWQVSVSGINQIISIYVVLLWFALLWRALPEFSIGATTNWFYVFLVGGALLACIGFVTAGRTHIDDNRSLADRRTSNIEDPKHE